VDLATVTAIRDELEAELKGRRFGKIVPLSKTDIAIDFRLADSRYLFISIEPGNPRAYLIRRKLREMEKIASSPTPFLLGLKKRLSGAEMRSVTQIPDERVLFFEFETHGDLEEHLSLILVAQLTGNSANLLLLDSSRKILDRAKATKGVGQKVGESYQPPARRSDPAAESRSQRFDEGSLSERLDSDDLKRSEAGAFAALVNSARNKLKQEISKRERLLLKLQDDLNGHGDPDQWKRFGDLLLANTSTARRENGKIFLTDYYDEASPEIAIDVDPNESITEAAENYFKRYTKARNALQEIESRRRVIGAELAALRLKRDELESAIEAKDEELIASLGGRAKRSETKRSTKRTEETKGARSFVSSDGFEILVGKKAKDNDFLTFRIAKSLDTWMHAADYSGSHVVIRNPNRKEVPHRTLLEAAQLAAFYSQGKSQPKAAVHYTQKKFVNKPKGAVAGLVSLASFKTILVEPKIGEAKLISDK
jgi:predicted ribosome quality control (RQC) complex YloA/Tae2 family protein